MEKKIEFIHVLHFWEFLYTVVLSLINLRKNVLCSALAKLYGRITDLYSQKVINKNLKEN